MIDWKKKLKFITITAAFAVLILIAFTNVFNMTRVSNKDFKTYEQGLIYLNQKDFENAYFNFSNVSKNSAIYEIALLRQALCADELKDVETAAQKYRLFIEKFSDSIFIEKAYYALAQNYFRAKDYAKAEKTFNSIKKEFKETEYASGANYYLGMIAKEEKEPKNLKAKDYFIEYIKDAPTGRFSMNCVQELVSGKYLLNQEDNKLIGIVYLKNVNYKTAYDCFNKSYMSSIWGYLSIADKKLGKMKDANKVFETGYAKYSQYQKTEDLYEFIESYALSQPTGAKAGWYKALDIAQTNGSKGEDFILYNLTKLENKSVKSVLYKNIYTKFPKGDFASDALANLFWQTYLEHHYTEAKRLGQIHMKDYPNTIAAPKVMFWMGKIDEKLGNRNEAKGLYQKLLEKYPDDYYAYRASKKLSFSPHSSWKTKATHRLPEEKQSVPFPVSHTKISDENISLIKEILKLNDYTLLGEIEKDNNAIQSWIKFKEGKYATSALLARDALAEEEIRPKFNDSLYKLAYQLHYQKIINDQSEDFKLDPFLVAALIREESYHNPKAESSAGARGLMQLMPSTASYIAGRNNFIYRGTSSLFVPEVNITLGCAYLNYAKDRLFNNDLLAVASYNGGPNAVRNWKDTLNYQNFDEFLENIPYSETRDYVKKVFRSYWIYLNLY